MPNAPEAPPPDTAPRNRPAPDTRGRTGLRVIPVVELGARPPADLVAAEPARTDALLAAARRTMPLPVMAAGDLASRRWLMRTENPYREEIAEVAARLPGPGGWVLNLSHEWACTSGAAAAAEGPGCRLVRALDWPMEGLGENLMAVRRRGAAGPWIDLTWPGFTGTIQGLAPGRFAAAFNQAPLHRRTRLFAADWALQRARFWRSPHLPPAHLLRRVFDLATDFAEAKRLLTETPLALPVIYSLAGPEPGQGCIIERLEERAFVRELPADGPTDGSADGPTKGTAEMPGKSSEEVSVVAANHWQAAGRPGYPRGIESEKRGALMRARLPDCRGDFGWLAPPVLNELTRLAMQAEPASGRLTVRGYEAYGPATELLELTEPLPAKAAATATLEAPSGR